MAVALSRFGAWSRVSHLWFWAIEILGIEILGIEILGIEILGIEILGIGIATAILRAPSCARSTSSTLFCGPLGMLGPGGGSRTVRIGNRQSSQNRAFGVLHLARVLVTFVVKAEKMQKAVDDEMREMMGERFVLAAGLPRNGLISEHDVAQMPAAGVFCRERKYIGGSGDTAPIAIERAHFAVVGQNDSKLSRVC